MRNLARTGAILDAITVMVGIVCASVGLGMYDRPLGVFTFGVLLLLSEFVATRRQ